MKKAKTTHAALIVFNLRGWFLHTKIFNNMGFMIFHGAVFCYPVHGNVWLQKHYHKKKIMKTCQEMGQIIFDVHVMYQT